MSSKKFLDYDGALKLVSNISNYFSSKNHTHTISEINDMPNIDNKINEHNISVDSHNDVRILINNLTDRLNALADSDDTTLDQLSEVVAYIKDNRELIDQITTAKVNVSDIINNLTTNVSDVPLSAAQGVVLKSLIEDIESNYILSSQINVANGVAGLNSSGKIPADYLPSYTEVNYIPSDEVSSLTAKQTWTSEQTYNYDDYGQKLTDTINGIACGFKAPRGLFNQLFIDDIVFTRGATGADAPLADEIGFYIFDGVESKAAVKNSNGEITTAGYNNLLEYKPVAAITKDGGLVLKSSTSGSSKYFKITVNDSGAISATQYTFSS